MGLPTAYAKRLHADAGPYGMGRGTHQLGYSVRPDDTPEAYSCQLDQQADAIALQEVGMSDL